MTTKFTNGGKHRGQKAPLGVLNSRFEVLHPLGQGATSSVFAVRDLQAREVRAMKLLHRDGDEKLMRAEFSRLSRLDHPRLVRVHDLDRIQTSEPQGDLRSDTFVPGRLFLILDLVSGSDPMAALQGMAPGKRQQALWQMAQDLAEALAHLHGHGLVHHDVKPDNTLLDEEHHLRLIDLGLATWAHQSTPGRGTLAYLAPEALVGGGDSRADLYGIGATLFHIASGQPPFSTVGTRLIQEILDASPRLETSWIGEDLKALIHKLLRKDPLRRPSSARAVLADLARMRGDHQAVATISSGQELLTPPMVGRREALAQLTGAFASLGAGKAPKLVLVAGGPGVGKTRLVQEATREHRIQAAAGRTSPLRFASGELRELLRRTEPSEPVKRWIQGSAPGVTDDELVLQMADSLGASSEGTKVLHFTALDEDPFTRRVIEVLLRSSPGMDHLLLVVELSDGEKSELSGDQDRILRLALPPLSREEVHTLIAKVRGQDEPPELVAKIHRMSQGNPLIATELIRQWHLGGEAGLDLLLVQDLDPILDKIRGCLERREIQILEALAVWQEGITAGDLSRLMGVEEAELWCDLTALGRRGVIELNMGRCSLPTQAHLQAWRRLLGVEQDPTSEGIQALHLRSAELLGEGGTTDLPRLAEHLIAAQTPGAAEAALAAGQELAGGPRGARALFFLEHVLRRGSEHQQEVALPLLAEQYIQAGRYDEAIKLVEGRGGGLEVVQARALARSGNVQAAETLLQGALPGLEASEVRDSAMALLGRLFLQLGRFKAAVELSEETVGRILTAGPGHLSEGALALLEMCGLAHLYLGDLEQADLLFARGEEGQKGRNAHGRRAHLASLRGMTALNAGQPRRAAEHYQLALEYGRRGGDLHGKATYQANLGAALMDLGHLAAALTTLTGAVANLERLCRTADLAPAICNLSNLQLFLGDLSQAASVLERSTELAVAAGDRQTQGFARMLAGDINRRRGDFSGAEQGYRAGLEVFEALGSAREGWLCRLALADLFTEAGRAAECGELLAQIPEDNQLEGQLALSRARLALISGPETGALTSLEEDLLAHCARLEAAGAHKDLWRAAAVLGRVLRRHRRPTAARRAMQRAVQTWEELVKRTPEVYHETMKRDPDAEELLSSWRQMIEEGEGAAGPRAEGGGLPPEEVRRVKHLLAINKRLNSELRLPRLLEMIMDTVIELTDADRGFLLLADEEGKLSIQVARNIDRRSLEGDELALSRSIAEQSARTGEPVITFDAAADGRFQEAMSVSVLNLRSVLAVPLLVKGRTVGTVYIDSRSKMGLFGPAAAQLVQDVADQAAIAIDNARLLAENQAKARDIEDLNRQLLKRVDRQEAELQEAREELRSNRQALQIRYDYRNIIGRTARMMDLFHLLDRVTDTELPVVIQGESGTGKELVARAIHQNGPRSTRSFISENCAAIPETLLESVLFGHVKGAFTGAERDRKGLFEVASGGTLFLDEVGEMSPSMQTKLLRVLQNGEYRRVGGTQTQRTDVRVITASNKDLRELVAQGQFREDLFYRLNVILIEIPALKERREDIPLLVDHFVEKHAQGKPVTISPDAMALLVGNSWPGNVRELENEIMRATALGGAVIEPDDLSAQVNKSIPLAIGPGDDLGLKARVEHLECELIRRALEKTAGNHTHTAKVLGLSRYGLLKKLKRYGISDKLK